MSSVLSFSSTVMYIYKPLILGNQIRSLEVICQQKDNDKEWWRGIVNFEKKQRRLAL